jgi:uncharacterized protein (TIGR02996 family)
MGETTIEDCFLADIIENPEDDSVRRIYADWLINNGQETRGEFILKQIATGKREYRESFILGEQYHLELIHIVYQRGFIIEATGVLHALMSHLPYLARKHPIQSIRVTDKHPTQIHGFGFYEWYITCLGPDHAALAYFLPPELEPYLQKAEQQFRYWRRYYSEEAAVNDLSRALILWAHQCSDQSE